MNTRQQPLNTLASNAATGPSQIDFGFGSFASAFQSVP